MTIYGNAWQYMAINGNNWQYMAMHGNNKEPGVALSKAFLTALQLTASPCYESKTNHNSRNCMLSVCKIRCVNGGSFYQSLSASLLIDTLLQLVVYHMVNSRWHCHRYHRHHHHHHCHYRHNCHYRHHLATGLSWHYYVCSQALIVTSLSILGNC